MAWGSSERAIGNRKCGCGSPMWCGWDADMCAVLAMVDAAVFLTHEGERWAVLEGRRTWEMQRGPGPMIWGRHRWHRQQWRAGAPDRQGRPVLVLVEHVCGVSVPGELRLEVPRKSQTPPKLSSEIPF